MEHLDRIRDTAQREITEFMRDKLRDYSVEERILAVNAHGNPEDGMWVSLTHRKDGRIEVYGGFMMAAEIFPEYTYETEEDPWGHESVYLTPTEDLGKTRCVCGSTEDVTGPHDYVFHCHIDDLDCCGMLCAPCRARHLGAEQTAEIPHAGRGEFRQPIRDLAWYEAQRHMGDVFSDHDPPMSESGPVWWKRYDVLIGTSHGFVAGRMKDGRPHLSLAGVHHKSRRNGVFADLVKEFARRVGSDTFSVSTYPDRYPAMAEWMKAHEVEVLFRGEAANDDRWPETEKYSAIVRLK